MKQKSSADTLKVLTRDTLDSREVTTMMIISPTTTAMATTPSIDGYFGLGSREAVILAVLRTARESVLLPAQRQQVKMRALDRVARLKKRILNDYGDYGSPDAYLALEFDGMSLEEVLSCEYEAQSTCVDDPEEFRQLYDLAAQVVDFYCGAVPGAEIAVPVEGLWRDALHRICDDLVALALATYDHALPLHASPQANCIILQV